MIKFVRLAALAAVATAVATPACRPGCAPTRRHGARQRHQAADLTVEQIWSSARSSFTATGHVTITQARRCAVCGTRPK